MKTLTRCILVAVLASVLVPTLWAETWATPPALKQRYEARLTVSPKPAVGQVCELRLETEYLMDSPNTEVRLTLPEGIALLEGTQYAKRSRSKGELAVHRWKVKILGEGNYNPYVKLQSPRKGGVRSSKIVDLYLRIREGESLVDTAPPAHFYADLRKQGLPKRLSKPAGVQSGYSITGYVKYQDKDDNNNLVPLKGVPVKLYNSNGQYENGATTDQNGYYSMSGSQSLASSSKFYVVVLAENETAKMIDADVIFGDVKYLQYRWFWGSELNDGETVNFYNPHPERSRILETVQQARSWCSEKLNWTRSKIDIRYDSGSGTSRFYQSPEYIKIYDNHVWEGADGRQVQAHEYGHAVHYQVSGNSLPSGWGPESHDYWSVSSGGFALKEGWAEFFAAAVLLDEFGVVGWWYSGRAYDFEKNPNKTHPYWQGPSPSYTNTNGEIVEGAVAALLWDIFDSPSTPDGISGDDDPVHGRLTDLWEVFKDGKLASMAQSWHVDDIREFKYIWDDEDPPGSVYIFQHAPGSPSIDAIYDYDLFGKIHVPALYSTIQAGINAAHSGDEILVASGTYTESLSMKSGVDLKKRSGTVTVSASGPTGEDPAAYFYGDSDILVEGIHFDGYGWDAVEVINSGSGITFRNCEFTVDGGVGDAGLYVSGGTSAPRVETSSFHGIYYGMQVNNAYVDFYSQNKVYNNTYGVYCSNNGFPYMAPNNNFSYPSPHNSSYDIYAASNVYSNLNAQNNFWGYVSGESPPLRDPVVYHANGSYYISTGNQRSTPAKIVGGRSLVASAQEKLRLGEYAGALADFKQVIEAPRSEEEALAAVHGVMFTSRTPQEVEKAISYLEGIAQTHAGSEVGAAALYVTLSGLVLRGDYEKALSRIGHLLDVYPHSAYAPYALLEKAFLFKYGYEDREAARRLFAEIVERYPAWEELPMVLAKLGGRERMWEGAPEEEPVVSLSSYPNPANPTATIRFALPQTAPVSLVIYNLLGQSVRTLLEDAMLGPGAHAIRWDGKDGAGQDLASGLYLCRLEAGGRRKAKKLLLLR